MRTTWAYDDKFSIFSCYPQTADTNFIPGYLEYVLQALRRGINKKFLPKREVIFLDFELAPFVRPPAIVHCSIVVCVLEIGSKLPIA